MPRYTHDCSACTFLGEHGFDDLYHCPQHGNPTLIARRSSEGPDYSSFPASVVRENVDVLKVSGLFEAYCRAREKGLPLG